MNTQFNLPFRRRPAERRPNANFDLVGRSYRQDKYAAVMVIGISPDDPNRVVVQRDLDGKTWTMPGWLMRLILLDERRRAA
jgi:hypothetical protein